jgi:putative transcriptional regulator
MASPTDFEWDEGKAATNFVKHKISFKTAVAAFADPDALRLDATRDEDGEIREKLIGMIEDRLFTVVLRCTARWRELSRRAAPTKARRNIMVTAHYKLDPKNPPKLSPEERRRLDAMKEEEIERNALSDPDNPPMTEEELARAVSAREVRRAREKTGLSQSEFAVCFRINVSRLRDLERGRYAADSALLAYLRVIQHAPNVVQKALGNV